MDEGGNVCSKLFVAEAFLGIVGHNSLKTPIIQGHAGLVTSRDFEFSWVGRKTSKQFNELQEPKGIPTLSRQTRSGDLTIK